MEQLAKKDESIMRIGEHNNTNIALNINNGRFIDQE